LFSASSNTPEEADQGVAYEHIRRRSNQRQTTDQGKRTDSVCPLDEVEYFEASGNYVRVHAGEAHYRMREKLSTMETRLPERDFVRIHRSVIVNRNRIHELRRSFSGKYLVTLVSGKQVTLSRSHRQQLSALKEPF
jgi:Response regulator of the LytR/AlgR family